MLKINKNKITSKLARLKGTLKIEKSNLFFKQQINNFSFNAFSTMNTTRKNQNVKIFLFFKNQLLIYAIYWLQNTYLISQKTKKKNFHNKTDKDCWNKFNCISGK